VVLLHWSALSKKAEQYEHAGCPGFSVVFIHIISYGHAAKVGALKLHPHVAGFVVMLLVSALSKQCSEVRQEHGGWSGVSVVFKHVLPSSHTANDALVLKLHSHVGGVSAVLQVSAFSRHCEASRQEQPGCPGFSVIFTHARPTSHRANDALVLKLH
jgi:hypothetical protein